MQHNFSVPKRKRRASCSFFVLSSAFFLLWAISGDEPAYSATNLLTQKQQLTASDKTVGDAAQFGTSVAVSGATALVGAPGNDVAGNSSSGAAYLFTRDTESGLWTQSQKLTPSDG
ncbi:MAG: FG-GAP repeat protein, partial [Deltaproteobacteria bacterium]|nr:FG-GAP repeat protein [Deltaproteobacteria bacterium]